MPIHVAERSKVGFAAPSFLRLQLMAAFHNFAKAPRRGTWAQKSCLIVSCYLVFNSSIL